MIGMVGVATSRHMTIIESIPFSVERVLALGCVMAEVDAP